MSKDPASTSMKRNSCSACTMIAAGVKFRKAPEHTCDRLKPKTVKFPKLNHNDLYSIRIQRGGYEVTPKAIKVKCAKQEIEGVEIPRGFEIYIAGGFIHHEFEASPVAEIYGWQLEQILKMLVMEGLRRG